MTIKGSSAFAPEEGGGVSMSEIDAIRQKYEMLRVAMDERTSRLWAASESLAIGRGGAAMVAEATGLSQATICAGVREFEQLGSIPTTPVVPRQQVARPTTLNWGYMTRVTFPSLLFLFTILPRLTPPGWPAADGRSTSTGTVWRTPD